MATITRKGLIHVRKTINFDGSANNGNLGDDVTVFSGTGWYAPERVSVRCVDDLVCSAPTDVNMQITPSGASATVAALVRSLTADAEAGQAWDGDNEVWTTAYGFSSPSDYLYCTGDLVLQVEDLGSGADITDGTLVIDLWYRPITDDGHLAGDDSDEGAIDGYDLEEAMRIVLAALAGKVSGAGTTSIAIRDMADTKDRITATVDENGNRTAVTRDAS